MEVYDLNGHVKQIAQLWENRRVVCGFLRHIGCRFCWQLASGLNSIYEDLKKNDIHLICIIMATTDQAKQFVIDQKFKGEIYSIDFNKDKNTLYANFKLKNDKQILSTFKDENVVKSIQKTIDEGFIDHPFYCNDKQQYSQDIFQLDGVFVFGPGNICDFAHRAQYIGDFPSIQNVLTSAIQKRSDGKEYFFENSLYWSKSLKMSQKSQISISYSQKYIYFGFGTLLFFIIQNILSSYYYKFGLTLIILIVAIYFKIKYRYENTQIPDIKLITPKEIDSLILKTGQISCDCSPVLSKIQENINKQIQTGLLQNNQSEGQKNEAYFIECENCTQYYQILCYLRQFLSKSHPDVGREGPVCPFVPGSLKMNSIYLGLVKTKDSADQAFIKNVVMKSLKQFHKLSPTDEKSKIYKTIILIFPNMPISKCQTLIDGVQKQLKASFIKQGLMIGEFHEMNNSSGLRNKSFYPLRTPIPCLAIRHMVGTDIAFMTPEDVDKKTQIEFLKGYIENFQNDKYRAKEIQDAQLNLKRLLEEN